MSVKRENTYFDLTESRRRSRSRSRSRSISPPRSSQRRSSSQRGRSRSPPPRKTKRSPTRSHSRSRSRSPPPKRRNSTPKKQDYQNGEIDSILGGIYRGKVGKDLYDDFLESHPQTSRGKGAIVSKSKDLKPEMAAICLQKEFKKEVDYGATALSFLAPELLAEQQADSPKKTFYFGYFLQWWKEVAVGYDSRTQTAQFMLTKHEPPILEPRIFQRKKVEEEVVLLFDIPEGYLYDSAIEIPDYFKGFVLKQKDFVENRDRTKIVNGVVML